MTTTKRAAVAKKNGKAKEQPQIELCPGSGQTVFGEGPFEPMRCNECGVLVLMEERATRKAKVWAYADHEPPAKSKAPPVPYEQRLSMIEPDEEQPRKMFDLRSILVTLTDDLGIDAFAACTREDLEKKAKTHTFTPRPGASITEPLKLIQNSRRSATIFDGERRYWSAWLCGLSTVPAITVDPPSDKLHLWQIRCGSAVEPLRPLEIADALIRAKKAFPDRSDEELAREAGITSAKELRLYLALADLAPEVRVDYAAGAIGDRRARWLATIKDHGEQNEIHKRTREMTDTSARPHIEAAQRPLVMTKCHFDPFDPSLPGGPCSKCPRNTASQRSLLPLLEVNTGTDERCTDRICYEKRRDIVWEERKTRAIEDGRKAIDGDEAKSLFPNAYARVGPPWYDLDEKCTFDPEPDEKNGPRPWREVLGGATYEPSALARNPFTKRVHELLSKEDAIDALRSLDHDEAADAMAGERRDEGENDDDLEASRGSAEALPRMPELEERQRELEARAYRHGVNAVVERLKVATFESGIRTLISMFVGTLLDGNEQALFDLCERREIAHQGDKAEAAQRVRTICEIEHDEAELLGVLAELVLHDSSWMPGRGAPAEGNPLEIALRFAGVEWPAMLERARADRDAPPAPLPEPKPEDMVYRVGKCVVCGCEDDGAQYEKACERHAGELIEWVDATASRCRSCSADCEILLNQIRKAGSKGILVETVLEAFEEEDHEHIQSCFKRLSLDKKAEERRTGKGVKWFALISC